MRVLSPRSSLMRSQPCRPGLVLVFFMAHIGGLHAQGLIAEHIQRSRDRGVVHAPLGLLRPVRSSPGTDALWHGALTEATVLQLEPSVLRGLERAVPKAISIELPMAGAVRVLDLEQVDILAEGFEVIVASTGKAVPYDGGVHYQGVLRDVPGGIAAISVFGDRVMGLIVDTGGQWVLGPFDEAPEGYHVLYRDDHLRERPGTACALLEGVAQERAGGADRQGGPKASRCVRYYWEAAYDVHQLIGGVAASANYLTGMFNQSALLFREDGIGISLSQLFIWNFPSPYNASSSGGRLNEFAQLRPVFNGDMAHLIDLGPYGGAAWLDGLCSAQTRERRAYSGVRTTYENVPVYSWSVNLVSHEAGHSLGSPHTHACAWNGDDTAIDGCGPSLGYTEGTCPPGPMPPPSVGGTIMSYCHLTSSTIRFVNGFGPQPSALMRGRVSEASCLEACGSGCTHPAAVAIKALTTVATVSWQNAGADAYDLQWRPVPEGEWTTVPALTDTFHLITGLAEGLAYECRVRSVCGGVGSSYGAPRAFSTLGPCTDDEFEPNDVPGTATDIVLPAYIEASISSASDVDIYRFVLGQGALVSLDLSGLPAMYGLSLLDEAGEVLATIQGNGMAGPSLVHDADAGTFFAQVSAGEGASDAPGCHVLAVEALSGACGHPGQVWVEDVTWTGATVSWSEVASAMRYDIQWREEGTPGWYTVPAVEGMPYRLDGLAWTTGHEVRVRSHCQGVGQGMLVSGYTQPLAFMIDDPPCEVLSPVAAELWLWLDGPYDGDEGLMRDLLRAKGLLPLEEPYTALGHVVQGRHPIPPERSSVTGPEALVDWVLVELRDRDLPRRVVERRAGLLRRDGRVEAVGGGDIRFCAPAGHYHVAVRHRNHLGCMSAQPVLLGEGKAVLDLRAPGTPVHGSGARRQRGGVMTLWAGDANGDGLVKYSGRYNDRDLILVAVGGVDPAATVDGYHQEDVNMDGVVRYLGADNDPDVVLGTVGGAYSAKRVEQVPVWLLLPPASEAKRRR